MLKSHGYNSYQEYLQSDEWKEIKRKVFLRKKRKWNFCNVCGCRKDLQLHHSSYKVIGSKNPGNTITLLCGDCHRDLHNYSKSHPEYNFYSCFSRIRNQRKKVGLPVFENKSSIRQKRNS
jgi:hypothetical protein